MNTFRQNLKVVETKGTYRVRGPCVLTGLVYEATYPKDKVDLWLAGAYIQDAMPDVSADDREFLISWVSPTGWDRLFAESGE